jgi:hypothetical protein
LTYRVRPVVPSGGGEAKSAPPRKTTFAETGDVVGGQLDDPAELGQPVIRPLPLDGVVEAGDCRSDRLVECPQDGLQMRHLAPKPVIDHGVVGREFWRLSRCVPLDLFRHRVSSSSAPND